MPSLIVEKREPRTVGCPAKIRNVPRLGKKSVVDRDGGALREIKETGLFQPDAISGLQVLMLMKLRLHLILW